MKAYLLGIFTILFLAGLFFLGYTFGKNNTIFTTQPSSTVLQPNQQVSPSPVVNYASVISQNAQSFSNQFLGISFTVPQGWVVKADGTDNWSIQKGVGNAVADIIPVLPTKNAQGYNKETTIRLMFWPNPNHLSLKQYFASDNSGGPSSFYDLLSEDTMQKRVVNGQTWYQVEDKNGEPFLLQYVLFLPYKDKILELLAFEFANKTDANTLLHQILPTVTLP